MCDICESTGTECVLCVTVVGAGTECVPHVTVVRTGRDTACKMEE